MTICQAALRGFSAFPADSPIFPRGIVRPIEKTGRTRYQGVNLISVPEAHFDLAATDKVFVFEVVLRRENPPKCRITSRSESAVQTR